ncbi:MAG: radical SAM protein, partial [Oscillospiraceae bacterium]
MPPMNLLIKPASSLCNLRCSYCFYLDSAQNRSCENFGIMSGETLENILKKALAFAEGECTIAYQGGEPTLAGLEFFRNSVALQKKHNLKGIDIHNAIQTNLFCIDEEWAAFFKENHFLVGVSLDGTKETNDVFRRDREGNGCFTQVMKNIDLLKKYQVEFNILTVVHSQTAKKIQSIYGFYQKCGFEYLQFIPCLEPFHEEGERHPFTLSAKAYGTFLINLFDLWYRDFLTGSAPHIRQFENYMEMLLGYPPESCGMSGICSMQNVIEADGTVYPCDFYVLDAFSLGNLNTV